MHLFFVDDARQTPTRKGMGSLVATGGFCISGDAARDLHVRVSDICQESGFPARDEFKWSPGTRLWMRHGLVGNKRMAFFARVLDAVKDAGATAIVAVVDESAARANNDVSSAELDATTLLLERVNSVLRSVGEDGLVITDQPGGGSREETAYLTQCLERLITGTKYVAFDRIAHNVLCTPSHLSRLLQVADLITSCTLARVAGESVYSAPTFDAIKALMYRDLDRIGGLGLKLHPDFWYANLYHWLLGDSHFVRSGSGIPLPISTYKYASGPDEP